MKIEAFFRKHLRNDEHFQFHTAVRDLIIKEGAQTLKIQTQFAAYQTLYDREDEGIKKVSKSFLTDKIHKADKARDDIYAGMVLINEGSLRHYSEPIREAAERLKILFDTYGNIPQKPLNEQTSAVHNILQELKGEYLAATQTVGINGWVAELETRNAAFDALMLERFDEAAAKTDIVVRTARRELDAAYDIIVERINALAVVEGIEQYEAFIRKLNIVIAKYTAILNARLGKKHHRPETEESQEPETTETEEEGESK